MTQHFIRELEHVKQRIIALGLKVSEGLDRAIVSLIEKDSVLAQKVVDQDDEIDQEEVGIEEECLKIIALYQPVTRDLRLLATTLKVNNDLERIADHSVNVARIALSMAEFSTRQLPPHIIEMAHEVARICHRGIDAFVWEDVDACYQICSGDRIVDNLDRLVQQEAKRLLEEDARHYDYAMKLNRLARELERVADLMTNIAEDTIYLATGEIVRHGIARMSTTQTPTDKHRL